MSPKKYNYKKIYLNIVRRGNNTTNTKSRKGNYLEISGKDQKGRTHRRLYQFDQIQPFDTDIFDIYVNEFKHKLSGKKTERLTQKKVFEKYKLLQQKPSRTRKKITPLVTKYRDKKTVDETIQYGESTIKKDIELEELSNKERQQNILEELLKPLVNHRELRGLLISNQEIWKHLLQYHLEIDTLKENGTIKQKHGWIDDANKTLQELYNEYTLAEYTLDGQLWQNSTTTKVESDITGFTRKIRTTLGGMQERKGKNEKSWPIKMLRLNIKIVKSKPRTLVT